ISILLGVGADTFYVPVTNADLVTKINGGNGKDRIYVGTVQGAEQQGMLDNIKGQLLIDGDGPEAQDELYLNDQSNTVGQTYAIDNTREAPVLLDDGTTWAWDDTTVQRSGNVNISYRRIENAVLSAGSGADTIDLHATHREQAKDG